jgi:hypothetical protein
MYHPNPEGIDGGIRRKLRGPRQACLLGQDQFFRSMTSPACGAHRRNHNSRRPSIALAIVTSSAYSISLPAGTPVAMRVTRTGEARRRLAR